MTEKIDFETAKKIMDEAGRFALIDVREEEEYITGHAEGAYLLPVDDMDERSCALAAPDKSAPVLVYCRSGRRSAQAAETLSRYGYERIYDVGSLIGWPYGLV